MEFWSQSRARAVALIVSLTLGRPVSVGDPGTVQRDTHDNQANACEFRKVGTCFSTKKPIAVAVAGKIDRRSAKVARGNLAIAS